MQLYDKIYAWFKRQYSLDLRALALMRAGIGIILITDLIIRANSIIAHYTDEGVMPVRDLPFYSNPLNFSFHSLSGNLNLQVFLFSCSFIFAVLLFLGYKTRLATLASWILLCSLQARNPLIEQGGDDLLRLTLFWGMLLPWGKRYSLDSLKSTGTLSDNSCFTFPALGFGMLVFSVYFFSALLKTSAEWHEEGSALYYAFSLDQLVLPLGKVIYPHEQLLKFLTHLSYCTELIAPCLLLMPFFNSFFRTSGIIALLSLHLGISLTLFVGLFFLIGIITTIGLLPSPLMDKIEKRFANMIRWLKALLLSFFVKKRAPTGYRNLYSIKDNFYLRLAGNSFLLFIISFCLLWNLSGIKGSGLAVSEKFRWIGNVLRLEQCWNMFSPSVLKEDGWFVMEGATRDSSLIDINRNGLPADYSKPLNVLNYIENDRWRKFGENVVLAVNEHPRAYYCRYLFRKWNREHPDRKIAQLKLVYMRETTDKDYKYVAPVKDVICHCKEEPIN
ncbi:MAG: HTTM domain-containing protein [Bacteroidia bacterium]